jgi:hypothetical protein
MASQKSRRLRNGLLARLTIGLIGNFLR